MSVRGGRAAPIPFACGGHCNCTCADFSTGTVANTRRDNDADPHARRHAATISGCWTTTEHPALDLSSTPAFRTPFPVLVLADAWLIEHPGGNIWIGFRPTEWTSTTLDEFVPLYYEGGPALVHRSIEQCVISLNLGGGVPYDWSLETDQVQLGEHVFSRSAFRDAGGDLQFVIYDMLFRVTSGVDSEACIEAAEGALATYRVAAESE